MDKLIQYGVEEAIPPALEHRCRHRPGQERAIEDHFDVNFGWSISRKPRGRSFCNWSRSLRDDRHRLRKAERGARAGPCGFAVARAGGPERRRGALRRRQDSGCPPAPASRYPRFFGASVVALMEVPMSKFSYGVVDAEPGSQRRKGSSLPGSQHGGETEG